MPRHRPQLPRSHLVPKVERATVQSHTPNQEHAFRLDREEKESDAALQEPRVDWGCRRRSAPNARNPPGLKRIEIQVAWRGKSSAKCRASMIVALKRRRGSQALCLRFSSVAKIFGIPLPTPR